MPKLERVFHHLEVFPNFGGATFALWVTYVLAVITMRSACGSGAGQAGDGEGLVPAPCSIICRVLLLCHLFFSPCMLTSRTTPRVPEGSSSPSPEALPTPKCSQGLFNPWPGPLGRAEGLVQGKPCIQREEAPLPFCPSMLLLKACLRTRL